GVRYKLTQAGSVYAGNDLEPPGAIKSPSSFSGEAKVSGPPRAPSILSRYGGKERKLRTKGSDDKECCKRKRVINAGGDA
ncbi:MAG: hypothetical protein NUW37_02585, partial [Planctomycetes bacterium]|nr:hypothetical protein [Planctomycetota bacterium]